VPMLGNSLRPVLNETDTGPVLAHATAGSWNRG